jgi:alkyl sulfatase BDS1-like metallo-beta-lactamase superfamily hydrolase
MDAIAVRLVAEEVGGIDVTVNLHVTDVAEDWRVVLSNRALHTTSGRAADADATVELDRSVLIEISSAELTAADAIAVGRATVDGDAGAFCAIFDHLDVFWSMFAIVEP